MAKFLAYKDGSGSLDSLDVGTRELPPSEAHGTASFIAPPRAPLTSLPADPNEASRLWVHWSRAEGHPSAHSLARGGHSAPKMGQCLEGAPVVSAPTGMKWGWGTAFVPVRCHSRGRGVREGKGTCTVRPPVCSVCHWMGRFVSGEPQNFLNFHETPKLLRQQDTQGALEGIQSVNRSIPSEEPTSALSQLKQKAWTAEGDQGLTGSAQTPGSPSR